MIYLIGGAPRAERFACPYIDMRDDFSSRLHQAEWLLTSSVYQEEHP